MLAFIIMLYIVGIGLMGYGRIMITVNWLKDSESNKVNMAKIFYGFLVMIFATIIVFIKYRWVYAF